MGVQGMTTDNCRLYGNITEDLYLGILGKYTVHF